MGWIDGELVLVTLAAMFSPTTLFFCVLALVLGERPLRTGSWFYLGALSATLGIGIIAAFVLGDAAAAHDPGSPKTWVAVLDIVLGVLLVLLVVRQLRRPPNPARTEAMIARMGVVASSPIIAIVGAGAALANPGAFIPIALKDISELDPSATEYIVTWLVFSLASLLPLALALVLLLVAPDRAGRILVRAREWIEANARTVAAVIVVVLALSLVRNGIAGLT